MKRRSGDGDRGAAGGPRPGELRLDAALRAYLAEHGWSGLARLAAIEQVWTEVAGAEVAAHVRPQALRDETLLVLVDHPTWAAQLSFLAPELLRRLSDRLGRAAPKRLERSVRHP